MASVLNTLVMVALAGTLAVLIAGIFAMARGGEFNRKWGNLLMRARVASQGLAILLLFAGVFAMARGGEFNRKWGNKLMRARVATQGLAILLLLALFLLNRGWGG